MNNTFTGQVSAKTRFSHDIRCSSISGVSVLLNVIVNYEYGGFVS